MRGKTAWNSVISGLSCSAEELQTSTGLWFRSSSERDKLYVDRAIHHSPSSNLTMQRAISKKDFIFVYSYYDRWVNGETGIRYEVSRKSRRKTTQKTV